MTLPCMRSDSPRDEPDDDAMVPDEAMTQLIAIANGFDYRRWPPEDRGEAARQFLIERAKISARSLELICKAISGEGDK